MREVISTYVCRDVETRFEARWSYVKETQLIFRGRAVDSTVA